MADIQTQVEDLIGSVGDTQLITDAASGTVREIISVTPENQLHYFLGKTERTDGTVLQVEDRRAITVWRAGIKCTEVERGMETNLTDTSSIFYPTADSPVYVLDSTGVTISPTPSESPNNAFIYSITTPTIAFDTSLPLAAFPDSAEYLIPYGAAVKCLQRKLSDLRNTFSMPPASPNLNIVSVTNQTLESNLPVPPTLGGLSDDTLSFTEPAPNYIKPIFTPPVFPTIGALVLPSPPVAPSTSEGSVSTTGTPPTYSGPVVAPDFSDLDNWINVEEDDVMAGVRVNAINAKISEFGQNIQNALNAFNKENVEYQAVLQRNLQDAQLEDAEQSRKLQKFQLEISNYQAEIDSKIKEWQLTEYTKKVDDYSQEYANGIQKYSSDIQSELNAFNASLEKYKTEFQKSIKNIEVSSQSDSNKIEAYSQHLGRFQAEVGKEISKQQLIIDNAAKANNDKLAKYSADLQKYQLEAQNVQSEHQQILQEISGLSKIYQEGLMLYIQGNTGQAVRKEE